MQIYFLLLFKDPKELPIGFVNYENDCSETFYRDNCEANLLGCYFMTVSDACTSVLYRTGYYPAWLYSTATA